MKMQKKRRRMKKKEKKKGMKKRRKKEKRNMHCWAPNEIWVLCIDLELMEKLLGNFTPLYKSRPFNIAMGPLMKSWAP